jgi:phytoene desaturase
VKNIVIIGSGFSGMSAASFLAKNGYNVTVIEKNDTAGGRARQLMQDGFTFDMGPSWYWMPDVFERYFACFGKKVSDYYQLTRLNPSYKVYWPNTQMDIPANYQQLQQLFEQLEPGSGAKLDAFLQEAAYKYKVGINKLVYKPSLHITEFVDVELIKGIFKLDVFTSIKKHIHKYFKHPQIRQLLEFPVLFLGALPTDTPALYSLMNYADIKLGTWYPTGGMYKVVEGMYSVAKELGVQFLFNSNVTGINTIDKMAKSITYTCQQKSITLNADVVIGSADYEHIETKLLAPTKQSYTATYWNKRVMAPSCLIFYVGINKKLKDITHHSLFFDVDFDIHGNEIYTQPQWPSNPLFYVSATSVTDDKVAPPNCENLFFLIPIATGLKEDTEAVREVYFEKIIKRFENKINQPIKENIVYKKSYCISNFIADYNSFKGNAYGLANTLLQTAILKPSIKSKKVNNLYYTGQLTVPGPGVPPSLISGEVVANEVIKYLNKQMK